MLYQKNMDMVQLSSVEANASWPVSTKARCVNFIQVVSDSRVLLCVKALTSVKADMDLFSQLLFKYKFL